MKTAKGRVLTNRRYLNSRIIRIITMVTIAVVIVFAALLQFPFVTAPPAEAQPASTPPPPPPFNPPELVSKNKKLRAVMEIISGEFSVPNSKKDQYRQFRGRYPEDKLVPGTSVSPGPTLRARLGDQVQISFLNKIDRTQYSFTYVTSKDTPTPTAPFSARGCDKIDAPPGADNKFLYPEKDIYPNCFHGSNTANIHFHGTHTSPDGTGDNVLVQVLEDNKPQQDWTPVFNKMFDSGKVPQKWADLPLEFRNAQIDLVKERDKTDREMAIKNGLDLPEPMAPKNQKAIDAGEWPQYFIGAFPNFFDIPDYRSGKYKAGQAPGTHWYHAHKHGSTSLHIRNGLAGAFVIESTQEGGYDHVIRKHFGWGDTYGDHEKIFVIQQFDPIQNLERDRAVKGKGSFQNHVNGKFRPTITMRPGEVQLWRFVNATQGNGPGVINVGTNPAVFGASQFKFVQTAQDGVQFSPDNYRDQPFLSGVVSKAGLVLAAGNRADLLVKAPPAAAGAPVPFKSGNSILFYVKVEGSPVEPAINFPTTWAEMPKFLLDLPVPKPPKDIPNPKSPVKFQWEDGRVAAGPDDDHPYPPKFMINDKQFGQDGPKIDQCMPLDGLQDWELQNYTTEIAHPFHIHINPFQVIKIGTPNEDNTYSYYTPKDNYLWQDVIAVPPAVLGADGKPIPGKVFIRQTYPDFTGTFVLHCHILAHEDRGMMQLVRIVPSANYPKGCQDHPPEHH